MTVLRLPLLAFVSVLVLICAGGCASREETVYDREVIVEEEPRVHVHRDGEDVHVHTRARPDFSRVESTTIREVDVDDDDDGGLFHIIGDIITLPFRAVGGLLDGIF